MDIEAATRNSCLDYAMSVRTAFPAAIHSRSILALLAFDKRSANIAQLEQRLWKYQRQLCLDSIESSSRQFVL